MEEKRDRVEEDIAAKINEEKILRKEMKAIQYNLHESEDNVQMWLNEKKEIEDQIESLKARAKELRVQ